MVISSAAASAATADAFGSRERSDSALVGIFYDLKQTQQRVPVPKFSSNYSSALPLYTTQLAIRRMNAAAAPRAFGVGDVVKPNDWIVHYKAQVAPTPNSRASTEPRPPTKVRASPPTDSPLTATGSTSRPASPRISMSSSANARAAPSTACCSTRNRARPCLDVLRLTSVRPRRPRARSRSAPSPLSP